MYSVVQILLQLLAIVHATKNLVHVEEELATHDDDAADDFDAFVDAL